MHNPKICFAHRVLVCVVVVWSLGALMVGAASLERHYARMDLVEQESR